MVVPRYFLPVPTTKAISMSIKSPGSNKDDAMLWLQAQLSKSKHKQENCASHPTDQQAPHGLSSYVPSSTGARLPRHSSTELWWSGILTDKTLFSKPSYPFRVKSFQHGDHMEQSMRCFSQ